MEQLRKIFKNGDKKNIANLAAAFLIGIALLVAGNVFFKEPEPASQPPAAEVDEAGPVSAIAVPAEDNYEERLERRLEETFSQVAGAGEVTVMVTLSYGREIVVAENLTESETRTTDEDASGRREQYNKSADGTKIILSEKNGESPLILKEIEPKVEGVIIVAKGGGDIIVKDALIRAAQAVLSVEVHKVQVLKMK
ncbi:MAG: hypothetical protein LBS62_05690 [Clostridiales bacterium]|jgi:stage III sporulation protein AG|nr:hypothetical protein [Clostridiales bacterium]